MPLLDYFKCPRLLVGLVLFVQVCSTELKHEECVQRECSELNCWDTGRAWLNNIFLGHLLVKLRT